jgi:5'-deoxynucleotidase
MKKSYFLGWMFRLRFIKRWDRMHNQRTTDVDLHSHCLNVATVAHLLGVIKNKKFGGNVDANKLGMLGVYHEMAESFTSDISSKIKYANEDIARELKLLENTAEEKCVDSLPQFLRGEFSSLIIQNNVDAELKRIVKAADLLVALSKAKEEVDMANNNDFVDAKDNLQGKVNSFLDMPEVVYFIANFAEGYGITIDRLMTTEGSKKDIEKCA